jgi:hypothetical protein
LTLGQIKIREIVQGMTVLAIFYEVGLAATGEAKAYNL